MLSSTSSVNQKRQRLMKPNIQVIVKNFLGKKYEECLNLINDSSIPPEETTHLTILRASCWTQMGINHEKAVQHLNDIIRAEPNNGFAYYGLGLNFYLRGEFENCLEPFSRAIEMNRATTNRAGAFKECALKIVKLLNESNAAFAEGSYSKALSLLSLCSLVDADNPAVKRIIRQKSDEFLQKLIVELEDKAFTTDDVGMILNHVEFLCKSQKYPEADKMLPNDEMLSDARGWFLKGFVKYMMGSVKLSLVYMKKALEMDVTMQKAKDLMEKAEKFIKLLDGASEQMKLKKNEKAVEMLTAALTVDDDNKRIVQAIYFQRAAAKFTMGHKKDSFDDYLMFESLQNHTGMIMDGIKF